jgi:beta-N-acetylhexosaminidase
VAPRQPEYVYRRRRLVALALVAAIVLLAVLSIRALFGDGEEMNAASPLAGISVERLIGQRLIVPMQRSATPELVRLAGDGAIGGVILVPSPDAEPAAVLDEVEKLQQAAADGGHPALLVAIDQEGGPVKRLPAGPPRRAPSELGIAGPEAAREEGKATARYLSRFGVNVDLAPVLDVPSLGSFVSSRAFGGDPETVSRVGVAFAEGLAAGGVAATAKHFPGLGLATIDTDIAESVVDAPLERLEAGVEPFRAAVGAGVALVMTANAVYPAIDIEAPASLSAPVIDGELRGKLGFEGVVITDDLLAGSIQDELSPPQAAVQAARAGADVLLFAQATNPAPIQRGLLRAAESGKLDRDSLEASYARISALKEAVG